MKALIIASVFLALNAFAAEIPGRASNIKISHIVIETVAAKDMVTVVVGYTTSMFVEDANFSVNFDVSEFSEEELKALSVLSAFSRVEAANKIFALNIREEERTSTNTYCPFEAPHICTEDEVVTDTYQGSIKIVDVVKN
jgi:hypothetical protein